MAWEAREIDEGRRRIPESWEIEGPAVSLSFGDAAGIDPALLAAVCGTDGLGGAPLGPAFGQDNAADVARPGPVLAALTEQAVSDLAELSDNQLIGALQAARRLENRAFYLQTQALAEFARRRDTQVADARARGLPRGRRPGEFPDDELAIELLVTRGDAGDRIAVASDLAARLPGTLAGMAAGLIDAARARVIAFYTASLTRADAARADEILAAVAPGLRLDALSRRAAALEMRLDPGAAKRRKEHARNTAQRVEVRREHSGNASLSGRELDTAQVMASKAHIDAIAIRLRAAGLPGTLDHLRALTLTDLTQGRDPLDRVTPATPTPATPTPTTPNPTTPTPPNPNPNPNPTAASDPVGPAPVPALINLIVPVSTLLGWDTAPAQAGSWGLLDPEETRAIVRAASAHPRTRWCQTITGADGTAIAHACAGGRHSWQPEPPQSSGDPPDPLDPPHLWLGPSPEQLARLRTLLRRLGGVPEPIARGTCGHRQAEDRYTPSRKLRHLIRARNATCSAPGCGAQASYADLDHVIPYPAGPTDECNLHAVCRRHHRCKQAPGWKVEQPEPGFIRWTTVSGRTRVTRPTVYATGAVS